MFFQKNISSKDVKILNRLDIKMLALHQRNWKRLSAAKSRCNFRHPSNHGGKCFTRNRHM